MWTLANILTAARIASIPFLVASFYLDRTLGSHVAVVIFFFAGITDFFDGYLARKYKEESKIGQFLDPIADKLMVGAVLIMAVAMDTLDGIHILPAVIILCRELLVSGLREFLAGAQISVPVTWAAKWKTAIQMLALGALCWVPGGDALGLPCYEVGIIGIWIAAILTIATGADYMRAGWKHMQ